MCYRSLNKVTLILFTFLCYFINTVLQSYKFLSPETNLSFNCYPCILHKT